MGPDGISHSPPGEWKQELEGDAPAQVNLEDTLFNGKWRRSPVLSDLRLPILGGAGRRKASFNLLMN